jgi:hypothetical protein
MQKTIESGSEEGTDGCKEDCGSCDTINLCPPALVNHVVCLPVSDLKEGDRRMVYCQQPAIQKIYKGLMTAVGVLRENGIPLMTDLDCIGCNACFGVMVGCPEGDNAILEDGENPNIVEKVVEQEDGEGLAGLA